MSTMVLFWNGKPAGSEHHGLILEWQAGWLFFHGLICNGKPAGYEHLTRSTFHIFSQLAVLEEVVGIGPPGLSIVRPGPSHGKDRLAQKESVSCNA